MKTKPIVIPLCVMVILALTTGCMTTTQKGAAVGTGAGAATGAIIGALTGSPAMGAAIGAGAGALGGALVGDHLDKKREKAEYAQMERELQMERQSRSGEGKNYVEGHYEYVKQRKWVDTSKKERVWVAERYEGDRRIEGHYEDRNVPSGNWQEYEEKTWIPAHYE
ncbi:MAG: glycine zipper domain-containing protein [Candidatus Scalindua sp.]|nr:glycine zipper domain-containing protein [Candidatus Scalindua sp.]